MTFAIFVHSIGLVDNDGQDKSLYVYDYEILLAATLPLILVKLLYVIV